MHLESSDVFTFWKVTLNISEMMQYRDIAAMRFKAFLINRKCYLACRMAPLPMTLKVIFAV